MLPGAALKVSCERFQTFRKVLDLVSVLSIFVGRMMCHQPIRVIFEQIELNNIKFILICCMPCEYIRLRQLNISNMPHALCHLQMLYNVTTTGGQKESAGHSGSKQPVTDFDASQILYYGPYLAICSHYFFFFIDKIYKLILMLPNDLMLPQWHLCVCLI